MTQITSPFRPADSMMAAAARMGLAQGGRIRLTRLIVVALSVAWVPILLLAIVDGTAWGRSELVPLLSDFVPYGRCFGALPLLILFIYFVDRRTELAFAHLQSAGLLDLEEGTKFREMLARARVLLVSPWTYALALAGTIGLSIASAIVNRELAVDSWMWTQRGELSAAGIWYLLVSTTLIRYLMLRALWSYLVWIWVLLKLARRRLHLNALHPDRSCGLMFLADAQLAFLPVLAAVGVQLGCGVADAVFYADAALATFKWLGIAFVVIGVLGFLVPLSAFSIQIWLAREEAEYAFDSWGARAARYLHDQMLDPRKDAGATLTMPEISALADASSLYDRTLAIRLLPLDRMHIATVVTVAVVSVLLPLTALLPLDELRRRLMETFL